MLLSIMLLGLCSIALLVPWNRVRAQSCCGSDFCSGCVDGGGLCNQAACTCRYLTPIIIDVSGNGFHLTSAANGVMFAFVPNNAPIKIAWTAAGSADAFLVLDRNGNGTIDDGSELFGSFTPQPESDHPNGFLALSQYDWPENGGNADGVIDQHDAIFSHLRLWVDSNHDGFSQPNELFTLPALGIYSINVEDVKATNRRDQFGNIFRYRAEANDNATVNAGRWAYDVILATK